VHWCILCFVFSEDSDSIHFYAREEGKEGLIHYGFVCLFVERKFSFHLFSLSIISVYSNYHFNFTL
jgi:hypothetical protein